MRRHVVCVLCLCLVRSLGGLVVVWLATLDWFAFGTYWFVLCWVWWF